GGIAVGYLMLRREAEDPSPASLRLSIDRLHSATSPVGLPTCRQADSPAGGAGRGGRGCNSVLLFDSNSLCAEAEDTTSPRSCGERSTRSEAERRVRGALFCILTHLFSSRVNLRPRKPSRCA